MVCDKEYSKAYYLKNRINIIERTLGYYYDNLTNEELIKRKKEYDKQYHKKRYAKQKQLDKCEFSICKGENITFR
jgi:hypothetical protein